MGGTPNEAEQRAATMIELARAYIALDDLDAARAMLHDVLREGSAAQRNEAAELADKLR
jgi:pilus assembly protein FimV